MENKGGVTIPRWAFGLAAAVVALLVVLVIVLIPRGGDNSNTSASGGSNGAAQSKATSTVAAGTCGAGASDDQAVLDAAPKDTTWVTTNQGWIGPVSKTAGPMANSPIRNCFEHSAEGALYAAMWATIEINEAPEAYMPTVVGPGAEKIREDRLKDTKTRTVVRIAGYRYISYTPERATVRLLFQIPSGAYRSWDAVMEWHDGDWHYWAPTTIPGISNVDPDEFITWEA
ncbi:acyl-CoA synthetase [Rothia mucilaginosa]|uniref:Acyl-CoA synthetase n=1 Tax=Rothia mucilaginosa TaxID=43675 RepID=A0A291DFR7_9MICC|nr:acyl-CoA synthetase [Rothia mucilaginosa]ATF63237.1 acyl-CoA synthetase [Rothia mucilaginosa]